MALSEVHDACRRFTDGDAFWASGLAHKLDDTRLGLAYDWVRRCTTVLLPLQSSPNEAQLTVDLENVESFEASWPTQAQISERSREIWFRPNRDVAQTAVSHLYSLVPASDAPLTGIKSPIPVSLLVATAPDPTTALKMAITEFERLIWTSA
jgi:hypothetical protein